MGDFCLLCYQNLPNNPTDKNVIYKARQTEDNQTSSNEKLP